MAKSEKVAIQIASTKKEAEKFNEKAKYHEEDDSGLIGIGAKIAGCSIVNRNWKIKNALTHFPYEPLMRTVDKFYPNAKPQLYIDEPSDELEIKNCQRKAIVMAKEGLRYCYITKTMTMKDVVAQLERKKSAA